MVANIKAQGGQEKEKPTQIAQADTFVLMMAHQVLTNHKSRRGWDQLRNRK